MRSVPTLPAYSDLASYPNHTKGHTLKANGSCSCGRWSMAFSSEKVLVTSHQFHVLMTQGKPFPATMPDPKVSTFPVAYEPMRDAFVDEAMTHPYFVGMSRGQIQRAIESRIWSIQQRRSTGLHPLKPEMYVTTNQGAVAEVHSTRPTT